MTTPTASTVAASRGDDYFDDAAAAVRRRAASFGKGPFFTTNAGDLFEVYFGAFPLACRQVHNCHACRHFLHRYGSLVTVDERGVTTPVFWGDGSDMPAEYAPAVRALAAAVARAPITGVFLSSEAAWGTAETGVWRHFAVPSPARFTHALHTAGQAMAEKREERAMLERGLVEFPLELVQRARALLDTDALYRSEKALGVATWLADLHQARDASKNERTRDALTWRAVATAPAGFCHVRSTMIGSLLEDLASGLPYETVRARFAEKMHPLQYQRPQAPPSAGNIAQAEKIVEQLKSAGALERRFAKLADIKALWRPRRGDAPTAPKPGGVFSHLEAKGRAPARAQDLDAPPSVMTWEKFARTVLPGAEEIECRVPDHGGFLAFVTSANADAPPILQWDFTDARNPVSWYVYVGGSRAADWNLRGGVYHPVTAIATSPATWHPERQLVHQGDAAVFILEGARDLRHTEGGGFFPEMLKSDYHAVRSTMEAYARRAAIAGRDEAEACGLALQKSARGLEVTLRVASKGVRILYRIDRWD